MSIALSIAFTGLCALIGDGNGKPGEILLLDAKGVGEVRGVTLPEHAPTLVVSLNDLANPDSSRPTRVISGTPNHAGRVDQLGLWDLTGSEVRIRAQGGGGSGLQFFRPSKDETSWPAPPRDVRNPASWRDLRFLADMTALVGDGRIDPALTGDHDSGQNRLPRSVAARVHLDSGLLQGAIPSQETYRDDLFEFRGAGSKPTLRQALTDTMQWTLQTGAAAVIIEITPVAGGEVKRLLLAPSATPHRLYVSNLPSENSSHTEAHHAMTDEEMTAVHFGAYYKLLLNEPADQPLPELWRPSGARKGTGLIRPEICPPAVFSRQ
jgi:hypothetical protein